MTFKPVEKNNCVHKGDLTFKVRRADIDGMKLCSLTLDVASYTGQLIKNCQMFLKKEKICYKMVHYTLYFG